MATTQFLNLDTDGTLSSNSDTLVPSEKAIKTYVDTEKAKYLPLTGGTLTGNLFAPAIFPTNYCYLGSNSYLIFKEKSSGADAWLEQSGGHILINREGQPLSYILETKDVDNFVKDHNILLDYHPFGNGVPNRIYQAKLDNTLYKADKRFTVTLSNFYSGSAAANLFDGNGETNCRIAKGVSNAQILIEGSFNLGMDYPYGYLYVLFYYRGGPTTITPITARVYQNWQGHNIGWVTLTGELVSTQTDAVSVIRFPTLSTYGIEKIEINFDNTNGSPDTTVNQDLMVTEIMFFAERTGIHSLPVMTKWGGDTIYGNLTIQSSASQLILKNSNGTKSATLNVGDGGNPYFYNADGAGIGINPGASGAPYARINGTTYDIITAALVGCANGVASLDANTKVPAAQIPDLSSTYLPLSGGTMTGNLQAPYIMASAGLQIENGSYLIFYGPNNTSKWIELSRYVNRLRDVASDNIILESGDKAVANGVASLDANTKVPVAQLPTMTGANGSSAGTAGAVPAPAATDNTKFLRGDGTWATASSGSVSIDNKSITQNGSSQLQTVGVIDQNNTSTAMKTWTGTRAQYDAITTKDANTYYNITDDTDVTTTILNALYPVGAIYIGTMSTCPLATLGIGSWQLVAANRVLQGSGTNSAGTTVSAGLPNITGSMEAAISGGSSIGAIFKNGTGAIKTTTNGTVSGASMGSAYDKSVVSIDASESSSVYGNSNTVQPNAYIVNIWERIL